MNCKSQYLAEQKKDIKYYILQGNSFNYPLNEANYLALHYAFRGNFIVKSALQEQDFIIKEESFFIAKKATNYILKNSEASRSYIITFLFTSQQTEEYFIIKSKNKTTLDLFLSNPKVNFGLIGYNADSQIPKQMLSANCLELLENKDISHKRLTSLIKAISRNIDTNYKCTPIVSVPLIDEILEYIRNNPATANLKELANKYKYNISYISEIIHKETGLTFSQTLKSIRMAKSLELLRNTNKSVNEIGISIGYTNPSSFIFAFHDMYNMTPAEYRRNNADLN